MNDGSKPEGAKVVAFIAAISGTGKTTLMEALITLLNAKGYRVGAVKHSRHDAIIDKEGSDSWRLTRAGTEVTVLAAKEQLAVFRATKQPSLDDALLEASSGVDIVLVEGFKDLPVPKIEVYRSGHSEDLYSRGGEYTDPYLVAVASDIPLDLDVPVLNLNEPDEVCEFIIERIIKNN